MKIFRVQVIYKYSSGKSRSHSFVNNLVTTVILRVCIDELLTILNAFLNRRLVLLQLYMMYIAWLDCCYRLEAFWSAL